MAKKIVVDIEVNGEEARAQVKSFGRTVQETSQNVGQSSGAMGQAMGKLGAAVAGAFAVERVISFGTEMVRLYDKQAKAEAKVASVIRSTGGAAGYTAKEIKAMASELQELVGVGDEEILNAQAMLMTFTQIGRDVFPEATKAVLNMSAAFEQDLKSSAIQLGKALNDPIEGVSALRRVGVQLTEAQEEQIRAFVGMNDIASAQAVILKELEVQVGGVAETMANAGAGEVTRFKNSLGDLGELIGEKVNPYVEFWAEKLKIVVDSMQTLIKEQDKTEQGSVRFAQYALDQAKAEEELAQMQYNRAKAQAEAAGAEAFEQRELQKATERLDRARQAVNTYTIQISGLQKIEGAVAEKRQEVAKAQEINWDKELAYLDASEAKGEARLQREIERMEWLEEMTAMEQEHGDFLIANTEKLEDVELRTAARRVKLRQDEKRFSEIKRAQMMAEIQMIQEYGSAAESALSIAGSLFGRSKSLAMGEATMRGGVALAQALSLPFPANLAQYAIVAKQVASIRDMIGGAQAFAKGGDFVTSGPQMIMVGDNPGGRERVQVTPLSSPNVNGPSGGMNVTVNIMGSADKGTVRELDSSLRRLARQMRDVERYGYARA